MGEEGPSTGPRLPRGISVHCEAVAMEQDSAKEQSEEAKCAVIYMSGVYFGIEK